MPVRNARRSRTFRHHLTRGAGKTHNADSAQEFRMDWDRIEGNWKQFTGKAKEQWGKLTDDDLTTINGKREQFEGKIQEHYGLGKDQVRKDVDTWLSKA
jgi:uncharacterized protein YjbJ (UPF0337 family)